MTTATTTAAQGAHADRNIVQDRSTPRPTMRPMDATRPAQTLCRQANGLALTTDDAAVVAAADALEAELLRYGKGVGRYLDGPAARSDCALAVAFAAAVHLFALTAEGRARAMPLVGRALRLAKSATARERTVVEAVAHWAAGDTARATALHMEVARRWPADLVSAKICQFHQLNAGDFSGMLACTGALVGALPDNGWTLGMHAFALGQTGDLAGAERAGREAAALNADPWAHHAVAHVLDDAGRAAEGRAWMREHGRVWEDCSSFMYTHNWWHAALFEIGLGDHAAALALFDERVWGVRRDCCQDQVNAVSLLVRFELLGIDVGDRWDDLAPHLEKRIGDQANAFVDLHYAYGLARAGRDGAVERQLAALRTGGEAGEPPARAFRDAVATAAEGMAAHARGDHGRAAARLAAVGGHLPAFGGSRTQRRLVDLVREDSARRAGAGARTPGRTAARA